MSDLPLFDQPYTARQLYGDKVLDVKMLDTSKEKLDQLDEKMSEHQEAIFNLLRLHPAGLGATQVAQELNIPLLSARPAMTILKRKGKIFDTGVRRTIGKTSKEAVMTSYKERADQSLIGSGQLARTSEARLEEVLGLKRFIEETVVAQWNWPMSPSLQKVLDHINNRIKDIS